MQGFDPSAPVKGNASIVTITESGKLPPKPDLCKTQVYNLERNLNTNLSFVTFMFSQFGIGIFIIPGCFVSRGNQGVMSARWSC